jgi:hypothetical protein
MNHIGPVLEAKAKDVALKLRYIEEAVTNEFYDGFRPDASELPEFRARVRDTVALYIG